MGNGGSAPPMTLGGTALPLRIVPLKGRRLAGVFIHCPRPSSLRVILGYVNVPALPGCPATLEKHREAWSGDTRQALECSQRPQGLSPSLLPKPRGQRRQSCLLCGPEWEAEKVGARPLTAWRSFLFDLEPALTGMSPRGAEGTTNTI